MDYPMVKVGENTHGGFGPAQEGAPSAWMGHVLVEDCDAAAARAEAAGGRIVAPPMDIPEVGRMVVVADPQGAVVSLFTPAGDPPTGEGVFVWDELLTSDVEGAKRFYAEVVGWAGEDMDMEQGAYTIFSTGETQRAGAMPIPEGMQAPPHWGVYLGTDDVDATTEKAKSLGATVYMEPFDAPGVGRIANLGDPSGAAFGLFKPSES